MRVSKNPTIYLEQSTLAKLEKYRQQLGPTKNGLPNYDKVIARLLREVKV